MSTVLLHIHNATLVQSHPFVASGFRKNPVSWGHQQRTLGTITITFEHAYYCICVVNYILHNNCDLSSMN